MFEVNEMTQYLMLVASSVDNYCKYLKKDMNDYSFILGYIYRVYQDKIIRLSPQGLALIVIYLKNVKEDDYEKYIAAYKDKVDSIIDISSTMDDQFSEMNKLKEIVERG